MVANTRHTNRKPKRKKRIYHRRKVCRFCADTENNRKYREAGFGDNLDWLIENVCKCRGDE